VTHRDDVDAVVGDADSHRQIGFTALAIRISHPIFISSKPVTVSTEFESGHTESYDRVKARPRYVGEFLRYEDADRLTGAESWEV